MATYAGVTFQMLETEARRPEWRQDANVISRLIPYGNKADVQGAGRGNFIITVTAIITADADIATLQAGQGVTTRTLASFFGSSFNNTVLKATGDPRRMPNSADWLMDLTFERAGS